MIRMKVRLSITIILLTLAIVWIAADDGAAPAGQQETSAHHEALIDASNLPLPEVPNPVDPSPPYYGLAIQIHQAEDSRSRYETMLEEIAALGADTVLISINGYQRHVDSVLIRPDPAVTPPDDVLLWLFGRSHQLGLRVVLMPKVLLSDPRNGAWRGKIKPPSWDAWFTQYRAFVVQYARLAQRAGVEVFIVGSELVSTEKLTEHWQNTIAEVKSVYKGRVAYSANWDHYTSIQFWDDLDLLGITTYFKLAEEPGPTLDTLRESWSDIKKRLLDFQRQVGKPLLFTEVGWCSQEGCSIEAWNYYRAEEATPAALEEQRRNYQAFIETWEDESAVAGMIWWEWAEGEGGPSDFGYTPKGKPAQDPLAELFRKQTLGDTSHLKRD